MADPDAIGYRDVVAGPSTPDNSKSKIVNEYVGEVLPNILDSVDLPTYHLKLYMIGPGSKNTNAGGETNPSQNSEVTDGDQQRSEKGETGTLQTSGTGYLNNRVDTDDPADTVVLAETGVTEVGIDGLEIVTVPGGAGSETSTVNFTITQPNAADFPDQIVKARTYLGAPPDAGDCPLFLEISFRGRKESNLDPSNWDTDAGGEILPNVAGPFVYNLILQRFDMEITQAGSTYNFETVVRDDLYTADAFFRVPRFMQISGRTIGQMLKSLEDQFNDYNLEQDKPERISFGLSDAGQRKDVDTYKHRNTNTDRTRNVVSQDYKVNGLKHIEDQSLDIEDTETLNQAINPEVDEAEGQQEAKESAEGPRENRTTVSKSPNSNKIIIDLKEGITMDKVLGILMSMNKEFMQKATRTTDIEDPAKREVEATKQLLWYQFLGSVEYGEYLPEKKQYEMTAFLIPSTYESPKTDIAAFPWEVEKNNNLTKDETGLRINQMKVRKAYEYIFTGRNDQILGLNLQYKEGIALLLPPDRGMLGDISLNAESILNSTPVPKNEEIEDGGIEKLQEAANEENGSFFDQLKKLKENVKKGEEYLTQIGNAANFTQEQIKDLIQDSNSKAAKDLEEALSNQESAQAIADNLTAQRAAQANVVTQSEEFTPTESGFIYGGDLIGKNVYTEQLADKGKQQRKDADTSNDDKKFSVKSIVEEAQAEQHKTLAAQRAKYLHKSGFANVGTTKGIKNNLFTYLYDQHQAIDFLMKLEMNLRGDPWWLGRPVHKAGDVPSIPGQPYEQLEETDEDAENYLTTQRDNFFLFSLNSPRLFDPDTENEDNNTGLWIKEGDGTSYFLSGIYQVRRVLHNFNNGVYTMDVEGIKETAISLTNADRLKDKFSYVDTERRGFSAQEQDGTLTESDRTGGERERPHHEFVRGAMSSSKKTPEELLEDGTITQIQYDAYKSWKSENDRKERERRASINARFNQDPPPPNYSKGDL